jgi:DNA-binding MurR/RpiR family transcriptional regulator
MSDKTSLLLNIRSALPYLNPALRRIAAYIVNNPGELRLLTINELAKKCKVSESTITRFVKKIELNSFQELKISIVEELSLTHSENDDADKKFIYEGIIRSDTTKDIIDKIILGSIKTIEDTKKKINLVEIEKAVSAIDKSDLLIFYCAGSSCIAAENARLRFNRIGKRCIIYNDNVEQAISASLLSKKNTVFGISNSGRTISTVNALKMAKMNGAKTVCITTFEKSPIVQYSDIKLFTYTVTSSEGSAFFQESMISKMSQILVLDILYSSFANKQFNTSVKFLEKSARALAKTLIPS